MSLEKLQFNDILNRFGKDAYFEDINLPSGYKDIDEYLIGGNKLAVSILSKDFIKMDRKKNRSDNYQYVLLESPCSPEILIEIADADNFSSFAGINYNEELIEFKRIFKERILENC